MTSPADDTTTQAESLVFRCGQLRVALPLADVLEICRPLRVFPLPDLPPWAPGLTILRGRRIPVIDLQILLRDDDEAAARWIHLRTDDGPVALAVAAVDGVEALPAGDVQSLPTLLQAHAPEALAAMRDHGDGLTIFLDTARLVPDGVRDAVASAGVEGPEGP